MVHGRVRVEASLTPASKVRRTVGGGLGLPSESSTLALVRLESCSSRNARSMRSFSTWRLMRVSRSLAASLASSTSFVRFLSWTHFRRYASSTEGGSDGGMADFDSRSASAIFRFCAMVATVMGEGECFKEVDGPRAARRWEGRVTGRMHPFACGEFHAHEVTRGWQTGNGAGDGAELTSLWCHCVVSSDWRPEVCRGSAVSAFRAIPAGCSDLVARAQYRGGYSEMHRRCNGDVRARSEEKLVSG